MINQGEYERVLQEMARPLRQQMREQGLTQAQLAIRVGYDRSTISRALSGRMLPSRQVIDQIVRVLEADAERAQRQWAHADALRRRIRQVQAAGGPPTALQGYPDMLEALRDLLRQRGLSQREVARRSGRVPRTTLGAMLRGERSAQRETMISIVRVCGVTGEAMRAWEIAWRRFGAPDKAERHRRRRAGWDRRQHAEYRGFSG